LRLIGLTFNMLGLNDWTALTKTQKLTTKQTGYCQEKHATITHKTPIVNQKLSSSA